MGGLGALLGGAEPLCTRGCRSALGGQESQVLSWEGQLLGRPPGEVQAHDSVPCSPRPPCAAHPFRSPCTPSRPQLR